MIKQKTTYTVTTNGTEICFILAKDTITDYQEKHQRRTVGKQRYGLLGK